MAKVKGEKPSTCYLKSIPVDVLDYVKQEQKHIRENCNCQYSLETTIYTIIRKYKKIEEAERQSIQPHNPGKGQG
jgi:hypothetical protein